RFSLLPLLLCSFRGALFQCIALPAHHLVLGFGFGECRAKNGAERKPDAGKHQRLVLEERSDAARRATRVLRRSTRAFGGLAVEVGGAVGDRGSRIAEDGAGGSAR